METILERVPVSIVSVGILPVNLDVRTMVSPICVTNLLMKVQHVTVSENSVHNSCVLLTVIWTGNFVLSLSLSANVT